MGPSKTAEFSLWNFPKPVSQKRGDLSPPKLSLPGDLGCLDERRKGFGPADGQGSVAGAGPAAARVFFFVPFVFLLPFFSSVFFVFFFFYVSFFVFSGDLQWSGKP